MDIRNDVLHRLIKDPTLMRDDWHVSLFAPLWRMRGFDQENPHHTMSLFDHSIETALNIPERFGITRVAAMFHDCGKVDTKVFDPIKGHATYHGHEKAGADLARKDLEGVIGPDVLDDICLLISLHMRPLGYINQPFGNKGVKRLIKKADGFLVKIDDLMMLNDADIRAHNPEDIPRSMEGHNKLQNHIDRVRAL